MTIRDIERQLCIMQRKLLECDPAPPNSEEHRERIAKWLIVSGGLVLLEEIDVFRREGALTEEFVANARQALKLIVNSRSEDALRQAFQELSRELQFLK